MTYRYHAFGLQIASEIECPPLAPGADGCPPDLVVRHGQVPAALDDVLDQGQAYQIGPGRLLLKIAGVARYLISGGCEIAIETQAGASEKDVRLFLLGSAVGALLHQRGVWPLHGSAVAAGQSAVLFVGPSGSGKSTLAAAFQRQGYAMLSDDVCAISTGESGLLHIAAAYPRLSLLADALARLGDDAQSLQHTNTLQEKYELTMPHFSGGPLPVTHVYVLQPGDPVGDPFGDPVTDHGGITLTPLRGFDKVRELTANTYRLQFLTGMQQERRHFQQAGALAQQARVVRVTRPHQPFLLDELVDLIRKDSSP